MSYARREHLVRFYSILDSSKKESAARELSVIVAASINWPARGVDFFREAGETRSDTGRGPRIVRVGTQR